MVYPSGWPVVTQMEIEWERRAIGYKTRAIPLVQVGQDVLPDQPVLRLEKIGYGTTAHTQMQQNPPATPIPPVIARAGLRGQVVEITRRGGVVIKTRASIIGGKIGAGQQAVGVLTWWQPSNAYQPSSSPLPMPPGAILVIPGPVDAALLRQAINSGVVGVVASSITTRDLESFLGVDMLDLLNSVNVDMAQVKLPPLTLLFTEGPGTMAMPETTMQALSQRNGSVALISGITSVRYAMYPELVISLPVEEAQQNWQPESPDPTLLLDSQVRVSAGMYEGEIGQIEHFFAHQHVFLSGVYARAARLRLADGSRLIVPLMNLERIG